ncbi:MAG: hypothetical protein EBR82_14310 [Caulobacteraceae bacterium]|jgi:hypothetical protein|nr:hypothetical protein [Caulobacteraceae bacterium]
MDILSVGKSVLSVALVYTVHYTSIKIYNTFCVPDTAIGFLSGMITTGSPICRSALQVADQTSISYGNAITLGIVRVALDALLNRPSQ